MWWCGGLCGVGLQGLVAQIKRSADGGGQQMVEQEAGKGGGGRQGTYVMRTAHRRLAQIQASTP